MVSYSHVGPGDYLRGLVPSGLRRLRRLRRLQREHDLVDMGDDFPYTISPSSRFGRNCRISGRTAIIGSQLGDWSYVMQDCRIAHTDVGKFTSIGPGAMIGLAEHPSSGYVSTHPAFYLRKPDVGYDFVEETSREEYVRTNVGNDVWIGARVCVRAGVTIGDGAIIGAGAVVSRDIGPYAVAVGVPARVRRYRFDEETIAFLLRFRWWDRGEQWLRDHAHSFRHIDLLRAQMPSEAP